MDMARYLFTYHGGNGMAESEAEIAEVMAAWGAWFGELGEALLDGGAPVATSKTVGSDGSVADGGGANPATGFSIIAAGSLDEAATKAKGSPALASGGNVEVSELIEM
jgi:hypothetical protein